MIYSEIAPTSLVSSKLFPRDSVLPETDIELLDVARTMNKDALVRIFDRYSHSLYKYALRICSDPLLADHIVGDVFAKFLDQLSSGNGPRRNLRSYLYQMTYHLIIDEVRYSKNRFPLEDLDLNKYEESAFLGMENRVVFEKLVCAIRNVLTNDQRHVIVLRFLEEMSLLETAAIMGKSVNHIKVIQNRAIESLRKTLKNQVEK
jgi:RNA polymerase sigma-70 factor (ECF subfamily)